MYTIAQIGNHEPLCDSHLSEVFWEVLEATMEKYGDKLKLDGDLLRSRANIYYRAIQNAGAPLENCAGFIDCTRIKIQRTCGANTNQKSCYSADKRIHCLIYQILCAPDGPVLAFFEP